MIGLYYKNIFTGDIKNDFNGMPSELSQVLHDIVTKREISYGLTKGRVAHIHINNENNITSVEVIHIRKSIAYENNMFVISSADKEDVFEQLLLYLTKMRNLIIFFVTEDEKFDMEIRKLTNKLKIKRKKAINCQGGF